MRYIADFHIHSKYSRATSPQMDLPYLDQWARYKGIQIIGTGDFTHPMWFKELKTKLEPAESGLYRLKSEIRNSTQSSDGSPHRMIGAKSETNSKFKIQNSKFDPLFILTAEISCIYTKNNFGRRVHLVFFMPDFASVEKFNTQLSWVGNLKADGRPMLGIDAKEILKMALNISPDALVVPAHCLLPGAIIHTKDDLLKPIQDIHKGDFVMTHKNRWRKVTEIFRRSYHGKVYHIKPRNFSLGLMTTSEHPFYAIKTHKNCHWSNGICKPSHINLNECKNKYFKDYKPEWIPAKKLERGDVLIYPRFLNIFQNHKEIDLQKITKGIGLGVNLSRGFIVPKGNRITRIKQFIPVDKNFCRLAGYYLAEGYTNGRDLIGFAFSNKEKNYIEEVIDLMKKVFGFDKKPKLKINKIGGLEILFYSKILLKTFQQLFYSSSTIQNASTKALPAWTLGLPLDLQVELFKYWWRGDAGYTASRLLMNQMKIILLRLGIVPSIYVDKRDSYNSRPKHFIEKRKIKARYDIYSLNSLSFHEDKFNLLQEPEFAKVAKYNKGSKYGWIDNNYIYLPIYDIKTEDYKGEVYNLEVEKDNSYVSEFVTVHNCWTPWYSVFGSKSGFNSLEECFDELTPHIYAIETGLSSSPAMNWRLSKLDKVAIISCSDAHSPKNLGREATVFDFPAKSGSASGGSAEEVSYKNIIEALKKKDPTHLKYTIEFFPEEGKYHYDGHRLCNVVLTPEETNKRNAICPVCGKPLTIGVMNRVNKLADRSDGFKPDGAIPFKSLVPLQEIIAEALGVDKLSKKVEEEYMKIIKQGGNEFQVLMDWSEAQLKKMTSEKIVEGIIKMREGQVQKIPGYDGVYGKISVFGEKVEKKENKQGLLF